jgi:hypothetical protein
MHPVERFHSKVDGWIAVVLLLGILVGTLLPLCSYLTGSRAQSVAVALMPGGFLLAVLFGCTFPLRYELTSDRLVIRSGWLLSWSLPYSQLQRVVPTRDLFSSPALSRNRLQLEYGDHKFVQISPADSRAFVRSLALRVPSLDVAVAEGVPAENNTSDATGSPLTA